MLTQKSPICCVINLLKVSTLEIIIRKKLNSTRSVSENGCEVLKGNQK